MPLDDTNFPTQIVGVIDETTALLPPQAASDAATRLLIRARGFIERGWCRYVQAEDAAGYGVNPTSKRAVAWCASGALLSAGVPDGPDYIAHPAVHRLEAAIGGEPIHKFNNRQETFEPVLAAFDRAIAMGREG